MWEGKKWTSFCCSSGLAGLQKTSYERQEKEKPDDLAWALKLDLIAVIGLTGFGLFCGFILLNKKKRMFQNAVWSHFMFVSRYGQKC